MDDLVLTNSDSTPLRERHDVAQWKDGKRCVIHFKDTP